MTKVTLLTALLIAGFATNGLAAEKTMKIDAENIKKAAEVLKKNRALFQDPEAMQRFMRLSQSMKKNK